MQQSGIVNDNASQSSILNIKAAPPSAFASRPAAGRSRPAGAGASLQRHDAGAWRRAFPNSGAPAAQDAFLRGLAWLHSFGYEEAIDAFRAAQKADPGFAMAYWGEAMSFNQPLWFHEDVESGRAVLRKLGATPADRLTQNQDAARAGLHGRGRRSVRRGRQACP